MSLLTSLQATQALRRNVDKDERQRVKEKNESSTFIYMN